MAADFTLKEAEMKAWKESYDREMERVTKLLEEVAKYIEESPAEGDSIMKVFVEVGRGLTEGWHKLTGMFDKAAQGVGEMLNDVRKGVGGIFTGIGNWISGGGK